MAQKLRIATRGSELALWQARYVKSQLEAQHTDLDVELRVIKTKGDKILDVPLAKVGGKGLFVKELEAALLAEEADLAVHSMKDVPMELPTGLVLAIICEREEPSDAFVSNKYVSLEAMPADGIVGTSSLRRKCHVRALRPDLRVEFLRGNVNTRLSKLDAGKYDALILASAGLIRLNLANRICKMFTPESCLPAVGQGAVGIECRNEDEQTQVLLAPLHHPPTGLCVTAERAMSRRLNGGCQVPIAGYAVLEGDHIYLRGLVADPDSGRILLSELRSLPARANELGIEVAEQLLAQGAGEILEKVYKVDG